MAATAFLDIRAVYPRQCWYDTHCDIHDSWDSVHYSSGENVSRAHGFSTGLGEMGATVKMYVWGGEL